MADSKQKQQKAADKNKQPKSIADKDLDAVTGGLRPVGGTDPCLS